MQCLNFGDSPCHLLFEVNGCMIDFQQLQLKTIIVDQVKVHCSKIYITQWYTIRNHTFSMIPT
jgi:LEA14-like dessication related protein